MHCPHIVTNRHDREAGTVVRLRRVTWGGGAPVAKQLGRDEKELEGVKRPAGSDEPLIAMKVRHIVRGEQHGVVTGSIQMAIGSVNDTHQRQRDAAFGTEVRNRKLMLIGAVGFGSGLASRGSLRGQEGGKQEQKRKCFHASGPTILSLAKASAYDHQR